MITSAPPIGTLATLTHDWRHVATQIGPGLYDWHGDLSVHSVFAIYRVMRNTHETIIQVSSQATPFGAMLFAAISKLVDPKDAYNAAARFLDGAKERHDIAMLIRANARKRRLV